MTSCDPNICILTQGWALNFQFFRSYLEFTLFNSEIIVHLHLVFIANTKVFILSNSLDIKVWQTYIFFFCLVIGLYYSNATPIPTPYPKKKGDKA